MQPKPRKPIRAVGAEPDRPARKSGLVLKAPDMAKLEGVLASLKLKTPLVNGDVDRLHRILCSFEREQHTIKPSKAAKLLAKTEALFKEIDRAGVRVEDESDALGHIIATLQTAAENHPLWWQKYLLNNLCVWWKRATGAKQYSLKYSDTYKPDVLLLVRAVLEASDYPVTFRTIRDWDERSIV